MTKRFIIALNSSTPEQDIAFKKYIADKQYGWWHWLSNFWLIYTFRDDATASQLRDQLDLIYPNVRKIVLEFRDNGTETWSGFGPTGEGKNMFEWIRKNWSKK